MPTVTVIQPTITEEKSRMIRCAAYCRVSSDSADQLNSFMAQLKYYENFLADSETETLVNVYADEGVTGTREDKREDFQRMMNDCRKGKIDRIYTKSISRFSRNTKDCLKNIRELKSLGITVFFEKENIDTANMPDEMMITIMGGLAQEESVSISKNMKWSYQKRMQSGAFITQCAPFGYRLHDNMLFIQQDEADIVNEIFDYILSGGGTQSAAEYFSKKYSDIKKWSPSSILYLLTNEKYIGDQMYLKRYRTEDFPFKRVRNHGEHEYYYIEESHEPIISRTVFEYAQKLRISRVPKCVNAEQKNTLLSGAIHCGVCGKICRIVNRKDTVQWACRTHQNDASTCPTMPVPEAEIIRAFTNMYNKLKTNKKVIITPIINQLVTLKNRISAQSLEYAEIDRQIMLINDQLALIADLKQKQMIDEETYHRKSNELNNSMGSLRSKRRQFLNNSQADQAISEIKRLASLIDKGPDKIEELDEDLLDTLIEDINIDTSDEIKFKLVGGLVLKEHIERTHR